MKESNSIRELRRLIDERCDGSLSPQDETRLNSRLADDAEARKIYLQHIWMEAELYGLHAPLALDIPADSGDVPHMGPSELVSEIQTDLLLADTTTSASLRRRTTSMPHYPWLSIAAAALVASVLTGWLVYQGVNDRGLLAMLRAPQSTEAPAESMSGEQVATITGTRDCLWAEGQTGVGFGSKVCVRQLLRLEAGLAEVTFKNGTRVILEGPSAYLVVGRNDAKLLTGQMSAAVPSTAISFTIRTRHLAIDNVGAQFGLIASADGHSEVHVFKGPIHVRAVDFQGQGVREVRLSATEAIRLNPLSANFAKFSADADRFVRTLADTAGPSQGLLAKEEFSYPAGPLAWQNGGFGWAGAWADLDSANEPHELSTNAVADSSLEVGGGFLSRGNRSVQTGQFNRIRRPLSTSLRGVFDVAGLVEDQDGMRLIGRDKTSVYLSFLQRVSEVNDVFYGFELNRSDGNANRVLCIGNGVEGTGYGVSSNFNSENRDKQFVPQFKRLGEEDTQAHLFVVRIDFGLGNHDQVTVYRDPISLLEEERCEASAVLTGNFAFDRISLGNFHGIKRKTHEVDEIRVGTSFAAVTGQQQSTVTRLANSSAPDSGSTASLRFNPANLQVFVASVQSRSTKTETLASLSRKQL